MVGFPKFFGDGILQKIHLRVLVGRESTPYGGGNPGDGGDRHMRVLQGRRQQDICGWGGENGLFEFTQRIGCTSTRDGVPGYDPVFAVTEAVLYEMFRFYRMGEDLADY